MESLTREECQQIIDSVTEWKDLHIKKWSGGELHFQTADYKYWGNENSQILYECVNKYSVGDFATEHTDSNWQMIAPGFIAAAVWITPLNDDYEGGELYFNGELVEQVVGVPIKYPRTIPHEIKEVTQGTRYSLVSWVFTKARGYAKS